MVEALAGTTWTVERVVVSDADVRRGDGETVTFGPGGAVSMASCNQCNGQLRSAEGALIIPTPLACTKRMCGPGVLELERILTDRALRREGIYLIADGPGPIGLDGVQETLPTVILVQTPTAP